MGVTNLLNFVEGATTQTHISEIGLANSTAAVDVSHWIYRGIYNCCEQAYYKNNMNEVYNAVIKFIEHFVKVLEYYKVELTFVFDGMRVPAKKVTHQERASKKAEARKLVEQYLAAGNRQEARKQMVRCIEVRFDIIKQVIIYCKRKNIKYIVAPYEADPQLAYLNNNGICQFVITEDTDLILYDCKKIIYKLDHQTGSCMLYDQTKLGKCLGTREEVEFDKFRRICIMSGCDYIKNIPSIGLQKAKKFFLMTKQDNLKLLLHKIPTYLKAPSLKGKVTDEYVNNFIRAEEVFKHHIVYDPLNQQLRPLQAYPKGKSSSDFPLAGKRFHSTLAKEMVKGNINLDTLNPETDLDSASDASDVDNNDSDDNEDTIMRPVGAVGDTNETEMMMMNQLERKNNRQISIDGQRQQQQQQQQQVAVLAEAK